jgi:hypothetical protein
VRVIDNHVGENLAEVIVTNHNYNGMLPQGIEWVKVDDELEASYPLYQSDLVDVDRPWRHDADKLARVIIDLYEERTGPLAE